MKSEQSADAIKKPTWFKLYPTEFLTDPAVERMSIGEFGLYCYLLMRGWMDGGIPASLDEISRYAMLRGIPRKRLEKLWEAVSSCWRQSDGSPTKLVNPRQERERVVCKLYWDAKVRAGKVSAVNRLKQKDSTSTHAATRVENVLHPVFNYQDPDQDQDPDPDIKTPPAPSINVREESDALPVLASSEVNGKPLVPSVLERVAQSIHARHPSAHGRRDCSIRYVEKKLAAILKHQGVPVPEREAYLLQIDRNHTGMCASEDWRKENGQFAKGLRNYLAPTEERYEIEPSSPARTGPPRLMA